MFTIVDTPQTKMIVNTDRIEMVTLCEAELTFFLTSKEGKMRNPIILTLDSTENALDVFTQLSSALVE